MDLAIIRRWATPVTIGGFILMAVTGIMMFFHIDIGITKVVHEWASWIMVTGVIMHLIGNWKLFSRYFSQKSAWAVIGAFVVVLVAAMLITPAGGEGGGPKQVIGTVLNAPLDKVAGLTGKSLEDLQAQLSAKGWKLDPTATTLDAIAKANQTSPMTVLNTALAK